MYDYTFVSVYVRKETPLSFLYNIILWTSGPEVGRERTLACITWLRGIRTRELARVWSLGLVNWENFRSSLCFHFTLSIVMIKQYWCMPFMPIPFEPPSGLAAPFSQARSNPIQFISYAAHVYIMGCIFMWWSDPKSNVLLFRHQVEWDGDWWYSHLDLFKF